MIIVENSLLSNDAREEEISKQKTKYRIMKEYERSNGEGDLFS